MSAIKLLSYTETDKICDKYCARVGELLPGNFKLVRIGIPVRVCCVDIQEEIMSVNTCM